MPTANYVPRIADTDRLLAALTGAHSAAVIGLSNMGKSTLLRALSQPPIAERYQAETGRPASLVHVDCNRMLDVTGQAFYEVILRAIRESVTDFGDALDAELKNAYDGVIRPESDLAGPLNFNDAMTAILEKGQRDLVLLLDEFDEAFAELDGRVFLNLRALRDRYRRNLMYVTANVRRLGTYRTAADTSEFIELSEAHTYALAPLDPAATRQVIAALAESIGEKLNGDEIERLATESGGHPGLINATTRALARASSNRRAPDALPATLDTDPNAAVECTRLWRQLFFEEQEACVALTVGDPGSTPRQYLESLQTWGLVAGEPPAFFSPLFERFVRRQTLQSNDIPSGLVIDVDAGDVWVDGRQTAPLTDLEFRLLVRLHERTGKVTDKYQIVEAVWGSDYIDTVDDSRIEKLVSRLRAKIEPDPGTPRHLLTVRGRGYRLQSD